MSITSTVIKRAVRNAPTEALTLVERAVKRPLFGCQMWRALHPAGHGLHLPDGLSEGTARRAMRRHGYARHVRNRPVDALRLAADL